MLARSLVAAALTGGLVLGCGGGGGPAIDPDAAAVDSGADGDAVAPGDSGRDAPPAAPTFTTVFSHRDAANGRDTAIEDALVGLIDATPAGAEIRVALYTFTRSPPSAALVRAAARGVDVAIVLDGGADGVGSEVATLIAGLGAANVHLCDAPGTACVGSGIMHHKTFLFSALTDGRTDVVAQASHNLTTTQLTMHNNAVIVAGDAALYAAYRATWDDLFADVEIPTYDRRADGDGPTHVQFFPRPTGDPVVEALAAVTCDGSAQIRVAMAYFTDGRRAVAGELAARARDGCDVRVVAGDAEIPLGTIAASTLTNAGVELTRYPARSGWSLHSKYLLIDAAEAGGPAHHRRVYTGSHNWTDAARAINDETLLTIEDDAVFAAYLADWAHVRAAAATP
ncbi:MAG: hypothetical protein IPL61_01430 [Myxococcales bacterium]|nr:hypothetical protein [Myxococcales bacterium]